MRIGSRASPLALAQSKMVQNALRDITKQETEIVSRTTPADLSPDAPLETFGDGGKGIFTHTLDDALCRMEIECAVHSLKDVPYELPDDLTLAGCLEREDARDCLITREPTREPHECLASLPQNAVIGTSSPRRAAFIRHHRPDCIIHPLRGNVGTRLQKLARKEYDAIVLASIIFKRLTIEHRHSITPISKAIMLPSACQAIIGIVCRRDDPRTLSLLKDINHHPSYLIAHTERAVLRLMKASCQTAIAVHAQWLQQDQLQLQSCFFSDNDNLQMAQGKGIVRSLEEGEILAQDVMAQFYSPQKK